MPPSIAALLYGLGICGLFALNREEARTSKALWIPVIWMLILGSRSVSQWLAVAGVTNAPPMGFDLSEQYYEGDPIDRPVFTALLVLGLIVLARRSAQVSRLLRANLPIVLFFAYCGFSVVWSDYPGIAFKRWFKAVGDLVMVMIVLTDPFRVAAIRRFLARVTFLLIPLSVLFIKYYPAIGRGYRNFKWTPLYTGVTTNKNTLGIICLLFGLASLWRFLAAYGDREGAKRKPRMAAHAAVLAIVLWLFWMADSMTSLSCFILAGTLMTAAHSRTVGRNPALVRCLLAAVIAVPLCALFFDIGGGALEEMGRDATLTGRTAIWQLTLSLAGNPFLGVGFESFWLGWRLKQVWSIMIGIQEAHNGYLEVFLNLGWVGIILLAGVVFKGYRNVMATLRRDGEIGRLMLAYFAVGLVYNFTEAGFRMNNPIWLCFLLATVAVPGAANHVLSKPVEAQVSSWTERHEPALASFREPTGRPA